MSAKGAAATPANDRIGSYRLKKTLGIGSFGKVKLGEHIPTGLNVAIKIMNMNRVSSSEMKDKIMREISILRMFSHPHVIHLYEIITTPSEIYLVMEYCPNGELFDFIVNSGKLPEDNARKVFQQIVGGIEYCHLHKVSHRDLKPENILLAADNTIRIADFGLSNLMRDGMFLKTSCGSPNYAAPEVISGHLYAGPEIDAWSCGVILYALVCGSLPFDDDNVTALFRKIRGGLYTLPGHLSHGVRDLIPRLLTVDSLKRMTLPELRQNPWFCTDLPMYLSSPPELEDTLIAREPEVLVVNETASAMGVTPAVVQEKLRAGVQDAVTICYFLVLDHRKKFASDPMIIQGEMRSRASSFQGPSDYLFPEFASSFTAALQSLTSGGIQSPPGSSTASAVGGSSLSNLFSPSADSGSFVTGCCSPVPVLSHAHKWSVGFPTISNSAAVFSKLLQVFMAKGVKWKFLNGNHVRCLMENQYGGRGGLKFAVFLLKKKDGGGLVTDFMLVKGSEIAFASFISELVAELMMPAAPP